MLSEEELMIRDMVRSFAERDIRPVAADLDRSGEYPADIVKKMGQLGIMGIPISEEHGGSGASFLSHVIAIEEISRVSAAVGAIVETHTLLGTEPIATWGTEAQKKKYLPKLAKGEAVGSFALTEPNAGSDAGSIQTMAVPDGDEYVINGSKMFISNAGVAATTIVLAKTQKAPGTRDITAFIVEANTPGYTAGPPEDKLGIRASRTSPLTFDNVRVPKENVLGGVEQGFKLAMQALDSGRVGIAAQALGIAQAAFEAASKYAKERIQFGQPISKLEGVQWMIADMATDIQAARWLTYHAAWLRDHGQRFSKEAAMAKLFSSEAAMRHTVKAVQVHGGYGYMMDYPVQRFMRDAKITEIYEGTSEIQRLVISSNVLR